MKVSLQWMLITVLLCLAHCIAASPYDNSKYLQVSSITKPLSIRHTVKIKASIEKLLKLVSFL